MAAFGWGGRDLAVDAGFSRAFWTVFDAHVTNFVAGVVLYSYGSGPIRGFAVTLLIGIITNLLTSVWISRWMFASAITSSVASSDRKISRARSITSGGMPAIAGTSMPYD